MVQAADEERRRIGRDLHDGAQQRLLALGHLAGLALRRVRDDPEGTAALLERVREEATFAHTELRELARGLHPAGAHRVRARGRAPGPRRPLSAARSGCSGCPSAGSPSRSRSTVYAMVAEALANAMRHAGATEVSARVVQRQREIVAETWDNGSGGARPERGTGLLGLGDRIAALGGTLRIISPFGEGTRLVATIPLARGAATSEPFLEFGYEGDGGAGDARLAKVLSGRKTVSVSLSREWDLEGGPPRVGQRLPMLDHAGRRRGAVEVLRVVELPFSEVGEDVVAADDSVASVAEWRAGAPRVLRRLPRRGRVPHRRARLAAHRRGADDRALLPLRPGHGRARTGRRRAARAPGGRRG